MKPSLFLNETITFQNVAYCKFYEALSGLILLTFQCLHITCSLFPCSLCLLCTQCICFVSIPYALTPEFYVNKDMFCSVMYYVKTELVAINIRNGFQGLNNGCSAHKK